MPSSLSFQPVEDDMPISVIMVGILAQGKLAIFWFQLEPSFLFFQNQEREPERNQLHEGGKEAKVATPNSH